MPVFHGTVVSGTRNGAHLKRGYTASADLPVFISTWKHGHPANDAAFKKLSEGGSILDAVEAGVMVSEADPDVGSVGYGGAPDASGEVTLDACIMDRNGNAGSVAYLKEIMHPISVARRVMEKTDHVMLVGKGAQDFALKEGFKRQNLLTDKAKKNWEKHRSDNPMEHYTGHDTISLLGIDKNGAMAGACTTSGIGYKIPGRVGDSPIIGAGLFVDNEIGAAAATGVGELVMKTLGSFLIVELLRNGLSPFDACREALLRIKKKIRVSAEHQVGFICLSKSGEYGACSLRDGFSYAVHNKNNNTVVDSLYL